MITPLQIIQQAQQQAAAAMQSSEGAPKISVMVRPGSGKIGPSSMLPGMGKGIVIGGGAPGGSLQIPTLTATPSAPLTPAKPRPKKDLTLLYVAGGLVALYLIFKVMKGRKK